MEHSSGDRMTFSQLQVQQRRTTVARLYLQQRTQAEIASAVGVNQGTVSRDLKAIQAEWQQQRLDDFTQAKLRELARIDQLEREYWQAWERSCQDREKTLQEKTTAPTGDRLKAGTRSEGRDGNPEFLRGVERCIELRCKILGAFAAVKIAPTTPDGEEEWHANESEANAVLRVAFARLGLSLSGAGDAGAVDERGQALDPSGATPRTDGLDAGSLADGRAAQPQSPDPAPLFPTSG
ncbi:MAG TPA: helix-turn-helix domain-containing protein [Gemmataceae bacterium]|jgi:hypothetical protein